MIEFVRSRPPWSFVGSIAALPGIRPAAYVLRIRRSYQHGSTRVTSQKSEIVVAGTGPAGMIAALGLAHAGFAVTLLGPGAAPRRPPHHGPDEPGAALPRDARRARRNHRPCGAAQRHAHRRCDHAAGAQPHRHLPRQRDRRGFLWPQHAQRRAVFGARGGAVGESDRLAAIAGDGMADRRHFGDRQARPTAARSKRRWPSPPTAAICWRGKPLDIATSTRSYPQSALVLNFGHSRGHGSISTEFHTETGPFTQVPLPGNRSSLVWVVKPETAEELAALDDAALSVQVEQKMQSMLGRVASSPAGRSIRSRRCCRRASQKAASRWSARPRMCFRRSARKA